MVLKQADHLERDLGAQRALVAGDVGVVDRLAQIGGVLGQNPWSVIVVTEPVRPVDPDALAHTVAALAFEGLTPR